MMLKCWEKLPDNRPTFKELYTNTSKYTERIAGYLEVEFNPFTGEREEPSTHLSQNCGEEDPSVEV